MQEKESPIRAVRNITGGVSSYFKERAKTAGTEANPKKTFVYKTLGWLLGGSSKKD